MNSQRIFQHWFFLLILFWTLCSFSTLSVARDKEEQLKGVYLGRLTQLIKWPATVSFKNSPFFNLCVLGQPAFYGELHQLYKKRTLKQKKVNIRYLEHVEDASSCHLLFIRASEQPRITQILNFVAGKPILTISETKGFKERGGMVQFYKPHLKILLRFNTSVASQHGFTISSYLLLESMINGEQR